jgi:hypothetical protein
MFSPTIVPLILVLVGSVALIWTRQWMTLFGLLNHFEIYRRVASSKPFRMMAQLGAAGLILIGLCEVWAIFAHRWP